MQSSVSSNIFGVATQEIWAFVLCIVLIKMMHTMKLDA